MQKLIPIIMACLLPTAAWAGESSINVAPMAIAGPAAAPAGFADMCRRHADKCAADLPAPRDGGEDRLSAAQWRSLFRSSLTSRRDGPSSIALADGRSPSRIAMSAGSGKPGPNDAIALLPPSRQPRPFWLAESASDLPVRPSLSRLSSLLTSESAPAAPPSAAGAATDPQAKTPSIGATTVPLHQIEAVNSEINRSIRRASDWQTFGRADFWALPEDGATSGDCEDFVLAKRQALLKEGVQRGAMSIALVRTARGELHAVLLVATSDGEMVLDNLSPWVLPWREAGYTWLKRQIPNSGQWALVAEGV